MPTLFVSHSHKDDRAANALCTWLNANGFDDFFVDHHSMAGLESWSEALRASAGSARVVVCLVSSNWLTSHECFGEFSAAWYMGKRIIPLYLPFAHSTSDTAAQARLKRVRDELIGIDLAACTTPDGTLDIEADGRIAALLKDSLNAAGANVRIGLDPQFFATNRELRP